MSLLVIVETRCIPNIRKIVLNHIEFTGWDVIFFHGYDNDAFVKKELEGLNVSFTHLFTNRLDTHSYNKRLTSIDFWEEIPAEKVLIFQHDSFMLRSGVEKFMQYDFIGAPIFHPTLPMPCQNGGFSLRSKSKMLEVINAIPYDASKGNEDIYHCRGIEKIGGVLPTKEVASEFSVESIFSLGTIGGHAISKYLTPDQCSQILNQYGE